MKEYIERAFAVQELEVLRREYEMHDDCDELVARRCRDAISALPAADVVEVRHGRWIPEACESISKRNRLIEYRVYSCSICGRSNGLVKKRYCPNCGARMGKEDEHEAG